ncbi:subtilisin inhibitor [Blakeslea trispora]|nr:subtilisin inhibitor [Blakeslea trispora]
MVKLAFLIITSSALLVSASSALTSLKIESVRENGFNTVASLTCNPVGGTHPRPKEACEKLKSSRGKLNVMTTQGGACLSNYDPVTFIIKGKYNKRPVNYRKRFSNMCFAEAELGAVVTVANNTK